jgi:hypothetical protein
MKIIERVSSPTPKFFKKIRNIGITLAAISIAILKAPIALPVVVLKVAGYFAAACISSGATCQTSVCNEPGY